MIHIDPNHFPRVLPLRGHKVKVWIIMAEGRRGSVPIPRMTRPLTLTPTSAITRTIVRVPVGLLLVARGVCPMTMLMTVTMAPSLSVTTGLGLGLGSWEGHVRDVGRTPTPIVLVVGGWDWGSRERDRITSPLIVLLLIVVGIVAIVYFGVVSPCHS
jgi:hypothetical protein